MVETAKANSLRPVAAALILDFGGVISRTLFETHRQTERALGLERGVLGWRGPFDPDNDDLWCSMQAGVVSERDYWLRRTKEVGDMLGESWTTMAEFVCRARGNDPGSVIRPEAIETIGLVRAAGCKLAILSNELDLFYGGDFRRKLPLLQAFDVICDATHTGILKPDPRAYLDCVGQIGLLPGACVFVDDQARNIAGAEAVGLSTVHFDVTDPVNSYAKVRNKFDLQSRENSHA